VRLLARLGRFLLRVLIVDAILAALTAGACWALGWHTLGQYGLALMGAGLFAFVLVGPSFFGSAMLLGNPTVWYVQSVMPGTPRQRLQALLAEPTEGVLSPALMTTAGLALVGTGFWLWSLA
jgi:hypothetical protein